MNTFKSNPLCIKIKELPTFKTRRFCEEMSDMLQNGGRVASYFVYNHDGNLYALAAVTKKERDGYFLMSTKIEEKLTSLKENFPQIYNFEREIFEQYPDAIVGDDLKPLRFHNSFDSKKKTKIVGEMEFFEIDSHETHQVAVGPVHAGIIEPGHFRFNCHGEQILTLEISLGYQHRGIEKALIGGPKKDSYYKIQTVAGDSTIAHTICYLGNLESLSGIRIDRNSALKRMIALELERVANHTGDLGGLATDIGFLPTASYCGRIRGDFLNMTADICGNRFGRNSLKFGGEDVDRGTFEQILVKIEKLKPNLFGALELLWETPSVMSRLENTGVLPMEIAIEMGIVGIALRASGINNDIRKDIPFLAYNNYFKKIDCSDLIGDVFSRGLVRNREILNSLEMISEMAEDIRDKSFKEDIECKLSPETVAASFSEGFRGEICHVAVSDENGRFLRYKITDPSFHNWNALAYAVRNEGIYDFPLCNKSFNL